MSPGCPTGYLEGRAYYGRSKLEALFGTRIWDELRDKDVVDFGCGTGAEAVEFAQHGARTVTGVDIRQKVLAHAALAAFQAHVSHRCSFVTETDRRVDVILSVDAFEHFSHPEEVLGVMRGLLKPDGYILVSFGPPWCHPLGGHLLSTFPWAHLVFTERALLRWRRDFKTDGATRFAEVEGGLNQMTIRRFEQLVSLSDLQFKTFETVPIRRLRWLANRFTREYTTSVVRCRLTPRSE